MEQLFDAIRSVVDAGINQDWSQLASGIAGIVEMVLVLFLNY